MLLPRGGRHARTSATATETTTKSDVWRLVDDRRGQEEASCIARGHRRRPACLAIITGMPASKEVGDSNGDNNKDKERDKDGDRNKDEVATKTTTRRQQ